MIRLLTAAVACVGFMVMSGVQTTVANTLIEIPKGNFTCLVNVSYSETGEKVPAKKDKEVQDTDQTKGSSGEIKISQYNNIRHDATKWSGGRTSDAWSFADENISVLKRKGASPLLLRGDYRDDVVPYVLQFSDASVSWVSSASLKETTKEFIRYEARVMVDPGIGDIPPSYIRLQVWIDPVTLIPIQFAEDGTIYELDFSLAAPAGPLSVPADVMAELTLWKQESTAKKHR
jgi:hypothetical protein